MSALRMILLLAAAVPVAVAPAPTRIDSPACLMAAIIDPDIAASFRRFDRVQSPAAARICETFLNQALKGPGRASAADGSL
jgi:hypothetical protein